jgi:putative solute:sodium symporter small subunit
LATRSAESDAGASGYWKRNQRLIGGLLLVWALVTFGVAYFARELSARVFGWPFSFWVAAQGALLVYLAIVVGYALTMERLDERFHADEPAPPGERGLG